MTVGAVVVSSLLLLKKNLLCMFLSFEIVVKHGTSIKCISDHILTGARVKSVGLILKNP